MYFLIYLLIVILMVASMWKIYEKAGVEGWKAIIPIYNLWVLAQIVGKPGWLGLLVFIPYVGFIVAIYLYYLLAKSFGKGALFTLGLVFLPFIFFPVLAFGDAEYKGPPVDELVEKVDKQ
jgi:hypothetical protein